MENLKINEESSDFSTPSPSETTPVHQKLDDFISLLSETPVDNEELQVMQRKFNIALREAGDSTAVQPYVRSARKNNIEALDGDLGQLFTMSQTDKRRRSQVTVYQIVSKILRIIISLLLILLGFGMIIMPAPPYFEMFTLFYLNPQDGVTIMDVISLIVAFIGVYILIHTFSKPRSRE